MERKKRSSQADTQCQANWRVLNWMINKWIPLCRWINRSSLVKSKVLYSTDNGEFHPRPTPPPVQENLWHFHTWWEKKSSMFARSAETTPCRPPSQTNVRINQWCQCLSRAGWAFIHHPPTSHTDARASGQRRRRGHLCSKARRIARTVLGGCHNKSSCHSVLTVLLLYPVLIKFSSNNLT